MINENILLSIIIPVYNVESYIHECISSLTSCESSSYELIIINDGTPDNSMRIVDKFKNKYFDRIQIINQKNQGLSTARNNGIKKARGKYIWCVDSDDYLKEKSIENIIKSLIEFNNIDVFSMSLNHCYDNGIENKDFSINEDKIISSEDYLKNNYPFGASVRFIIKKEFIEINNLFFTPKILHEDGDFGLRLLYHTEKICILKNVYYNYRIRNNSSIMSSWREKNSLDLIYITHSLFYLLKKNDLNRNKCVYMDALFNILFASILFAKNKWCSKEFKRFYTSKKNNIRKEALNLIKYCNPKIKLRIIFFLISPIYYVKGILYIKEKYK